MSASVPKRRTRLGPGALRLAGSAVIQTLELGARIMRYELADYEWTAIKPMLPNKPRGVPRVNDRRVLNGIFWILRSGAPWRDLPDGVWPIHHLLQPLRPLAAGWCLGPHHRRTCRCTRCSCPDDRHLDCPRASAWSLHHKKPAPIDGKVTRRLDEQNSCGGR